MAQKTLIKNIYNLFSYNKYVFNFKSFTFWNKFYISSFVCIMWLCFIAFVSSNILKRITNPLEFTSNSNLIIEIYPENTKEKSLIKQSIITDYLKTQNNIKSFEVKSEQQLLETLNDFRGNFKNKLEKLPLPIIISVEINDYNTDYIQTLRLTLSQKVKNVYVDTQKDLINRLSKPISTAQYFTTIIPLIAIAILMAMLFLILYAIVFSNSQTIEVLLLLGIFKKKLLNDFAIWVFGNTIKSSLITIIFISISIFIIKYIFFLDFASFAINDILIYLCFILIVLPLLTSILSILFVNNILSTNFQNRK